MLEECFTDVSLVFEGSFKKVSRKMQVYFYSASNMFKKKGFKSISKVLTGSSKGVPRKF